MLLVHAICFCLGSWSLLPLIGACDWHVTLTYDIGCILLVYVLPGPNHSSRAKPGKKVKKVKNQKGKKVKKVKHSEKMIDQKVMMMDHYTVKSYNNTLYVIYII